MWSWACARAQERVREAVPVRVPEVGIQGWAGIHPDQPPALLNLDHRIQTSSHVSPTCNLHPKPAKHHTSHDGPC